MLFSIFINAFSKINALLGRCKKKGAMIYWQVIKPLCWWFMINKKKILETVSCWHLSSFSMEASECIVGLKWSWFPKREEIKSPLCAYIVSSLRDSTPAKWYIGAIINITFIEGNEGIVLIREKQYNINCFRICRPTLPSKECDCFIIILLIVQPFSLLKIRRPIGYVYVALDDWFSICEYR